MKKLKQAQDYQLLATQFAVGDSVKPFAHPIEQVGRLVALWPAIGMADVAFPSGVRRFPVEELSKVDEDTSYLKYPSIPGGATVAVAGGPYPQETKMRRRVVLGHLLKK